MDSEQIKRLVSEMTLEEKAGLCSGEDFWHTKGIERLGVPQMMVSDGPHGLRKQDTEADHLGVNDSIKAVCFPAGCGAATSFNRDLIYEMGQILGSECVSEGVGVLLGPAVNIKRSPLCGRNFEYYSEDPYLASEIAAALISGVQSRNVGTSIKHFMANSQETRRMSVDEEIDERALHEIYLRVFEGAVRKAKPWTVMSSYNKVNGKYVGENYEYMTKELRENWGFDGLVMSDWGAVGDRVAGLEAGLDLEMPGSHGVRDKLIAEAVKDGTLDEAVLDTACERILDIVFRASAADGPQIDFMEDHEKAARLAEETVVLLKNEDGILPLKKEAKIAFIGKYAETPRFQGGGSSHINCIKVTSALDALKDMGVSVMYAKGFEDAEDAIDGELEREAVETAAKADAAVIFAGLPDAFESEGFDRSHMRMPDCQNHLISEIIKRQPNVVVVLHNGAPIELPWADGAKGILEAYLGGEAIGKAVCRILFGEVNPSAKLAETFPYKLEDNPSYLTGFGSGDKVRFSEGIFVGYRYYDKKKTEVRFPFGYGLSYTDFEYSNLRLSAKELDESEALTVRVDVTNTGSVFGREIVQLYVSDTESTEIRPIKELKGFEKLSLEPGETKTAEFVLDRRAFAYYEPRIKDWHVESGSFDIMIGKSSRDIVLCETVTVRSLKRLPVHYTSDTIFGDLFDNPEAMEIVKPVIDGYMKGVMSAGSESAAEAISREMIDAMIRYLPIHAVMSFSAEAISPELIDETVRRLNEMKK
ncbi:MAG: glycoside hydrolase family 3 C-terminal domain-containing protein [Butyrivibrio sp.]|nr:glycoside hydrolase family 3 C-terminal domain-containing protein [Butyrivibrio sp.]